MSNKTRLLVMTKSPELGKVKTRMQPTLSQQQSVDLHLALSQYALSQWLEANVCAIELWVGGDIRLCQQKLSLGNNLPMLSLYPQSQGDLGERMLYAVTQHFPVSGVSSTQSVILVGTDCPWITEDYLRQAVNGLKDHDVVIGPAKDGGYVLLGMNNRYSDLFDNIAWGTDIVFSQTMNKIADLGLSCLQLDALSDIDVPKDLALLSMEPNKPSMQAHQPFPQGLGQFSALATIPTPYTPTS